MRKSTPLDRTSVIAYTAYTQCGQRDVQFHTALAGALRGRGG
jgi:hypothetical protein